MWSNLVCNHTRDETNQTPAVRSADFVNHSYVYRRNWTPLSPITNINLLLWLLFTSDIHVSIN